MIRGRSCGKEGEKIMDKGAIISSIGIVGAMAMVCCMDSGMFLPATIMAIGFVAMAFIGSLISDYDTSKQKGFVEPDADDLDCEEIEEEPEPMRPVAISRIARNRAEVFDTWMKHGTFDK